MAHDDEAKEYTVRIPTRNAKKSHHIMKFNASLKVDPAKWTQVRMVRENFKKDQKTVDETAIPKFGAGSEFGREQREEARKRRYGNAAKKSDPDEQPWLMRIGNKKEGKQYRGVREGGVADNAAYYVFTHAQDGAFEAHKVKDWFNFTPRINYRTFTAEEAEERFAERARILNHFAVMVNKKLRPDEDEEDHSEDKKGEGGKKKAGGKGKSLKISDMDDWVNNSADELDSDNSDKQGDSDDDSQSKKKKSGGGRSKDSKKRSKKKTRADVEGIEDSDDGDDEGREVDYMSDESSESEEELEEQANQKGVDQDQGLAKMLDSDESSEEEDENKEQDEEEDDEEKKKGGSKGGSKNTSRAGTPTPKAEGEADSKASRAEKRKALVESVLDPNAAKKPRLDGFSSSSTGAATSSAAAGGVSAMEAAFEEDVRRYLARKPMTTTDILKKFKSKKLGIPRDDLMPLLVNVLKRINPHKQKLKGTMYLSLKK